MSEQKNVQTLMLEKVEELQKFAKNQEIIEKNKKTIASKKGLSDNGEILVDNFQQQRSKNIKVAVAISTIIRVLLMIGGGIAIYFIFKNYFPQLLEFLIAENEVAEVDRIADVYELMNYLQIFLYIGLGSYVVYAIWGMIINSDQKDNEGLNYTFAAIWALAKIGNLIWGVILGFGMTNLTNGADTYFAELGNFLTRIGISLAIHIALIVLYKYISTNTFAKILDNTTLKKATEKDMAQIEASQADGTLDQEIEKLEKENRKLSSLISQEDARKLINELEDVSPMYCDFYTSESDGIKINKTKFDVFKKTLNECIEMINSGRCENMKDALKEINKKK